MRSAFTMIELIFVIVILGILATVSVPKFMGVVETTKGTICKAFVGTLNRTVSHSIWSNSILNTPIDYSVTLVSLQNHIEEQIECGTLTQYVDATNGTPFTITIGNNNYSISGSLADKTSPAHWVIVPE